MLVDTATVTADEMCTVETKQSFSRSICYGLFRLNLSKPIHNDNKYILKKKKMRRPQRFHAKTPVASVNCMQKCQLVPNFRLHQLSLTWSELKKKKKRIELKICMISVVFKASPFNIWLIKCCFFRSAPFETACDTKISYGSRFDPQHYYYYYYLPCQ